MAMDIPANIYTRHTRGSLSLLELEQSSHEREERGGRELREGNTEAFMGKKKKKGGGGGGGGGGSAQTGDGQHTNISPSSPAPDHQAPCNTDQDDANTDNPHAHSGAEVIYNNKGGKGSGKEGGTFVTAVLKVDFHCDGCADKIQRSFKGFKGVEGVKMEPGANKITVVGTMDPWKLQDRIQKKTRKKVEVISPARKKQGGGGGGGEKQNNPKNKNGDEKREKHCDLNSKETEKGDKEDEKKGDTKQDENSCDPKEAGKKGDKQVTLVANTVVIKVALHCDGCIRRIRGVLTKIKGVEQVMIDTPKNQITVKGTMKTKGFVEYLSKKIERHVEVVGQKKEKEEEKEKEKEKEEKKEMEKSCAGQMTCHADMGWCHCDKCGYHVYMVPAPQLFSDENPNACAVL